MPAIENPTLIERLEPTARDDRKFHLWSHAEAVAIMAKLGPSANIYDLAEPTLSEHQAFFGRMGGQKRSEAKTASCRRNAARGGLATAKRAKEQAI